MVNQIGIEFVIGFVLIVCYFALKLKKFKSIQYFQTPVTHYAQQFKSGLLNFTHARTFLLSKLVDKKISSEVEKIN